MFRTSVSYVFQMNTMETTFAIVIAILFTYFATQLSNVISGYNDKIYTNPKRKEIELKKFISQLSFGLLALFGGGLAKNRVVQSGLIIGGLFTILYAVSNYWSYMTQTVRTVVTGLALVLVIGFVLKFYPHFLKSGKIY